MESKERLFSKKGDNWLQQLHAFFRKTKGHRDTAINSKESPKSVYECCISF